MESLPTGSIAPSNNMYLSIPYSHEDERIMRRRFKTANKVAWHLMNSGPSTQGPAVFSPISMSHSIEAEVEERQGHEFWMAQDLPYLDNGWADALIVVTAGGWRESTGVTAELQKAREMGIPVFSFDPIRALDLVGISGKKRAGKDTMGDVFAEYGYEQYAFAGPIKDICADTFLLSDEQLDGDRKEEEDPFWGLSPREIMQKIGSEAFRDTFGKNVWVDSLLQRIRLELPPKAVVTDVRLPNELRGILSAGGDVIRIDASERLSHDDDHHTETALDGVPDNEYDHVVLNNNTLADFLHVSRRIVEQHYA